jgi:hypothetical protein
MTGPQILEQRRAAAIAVAVEAIDEMQGSTPRLEAAKAEPIGQDLDTMAAVIEALALVASRQETAFNHLGTHVLAGLDKENERLGERVEALEKPKKGGSRKG